MISTVVRIYLATVHIKVAVVLSYSDKVISILIHFAIVKFDSTVLRPNISYRTVISCIISMHCHIVELCIGRIIQKDTGTFYRYVVAKLTAVHNQL